MAFALALANLYLVESPAARDLKEEEVHSRTGAHLRSLQPHMEEIPLYCEAAGKSTASLLLGQIPPTFNQPQAPAAGAAHLVIACPCCERPESCPLRERARESLAIAQGLPVVSNSRLLPCVQPFLIHLRPYHPQR